MGYRGSRASTPARSSRRLIVRMSPWLRPRRTSAFDAIVVLVREGPRLRLLDAEDLVGADDDPAAVFELDNHFLGENFQSQNPALASAGDHPRADGRQIPLEGLVGIELVPEAAFEPTTPAGDFRGV